MKNLRTNSKQVKEAVKQYILETVYNEDENTFPTFEESAKYLKADFERVTNYPNNLHRFPNNVDRFSDYLCGGPFWFPVYTYQIVDFLNSLGINNDKKEYDSDKSTYLFALLIYREIDKF